MPIDMRVPAHQEAVVLGPDDPASFEPRSAEQELRGIGGMCVLRNIQGVEVWLSSLFEHAMIESFELTPAYKRCLWVLERTATPIERLEVHHTYIVAVFRQEWRRSSVIVPVTIDSRMSVWDRLRRDADDDNNG
jgi:hypothetical protein